MPARRAPWKGRPGRSGVGGERYAVGVYLGLAVSPPRLFPLNSLLAPAALAVLVASVAVAAGCGDDSGGGDAGDGGLDGAADGGDTAVDAGESGPVELVFEANTESNFFDRPFPLETRRTADGSPDVEGFPNPRRTTLIQDFQDTVGDRDGFSPSAPIWLRFTGPLDPSLFPTPAQSITAESPILLVNVDPASPDVGKLTPVRIQQTDAAGDSYRPPRLLSVLPVPGHNLDESTTYALVVRDTIGTGDPERPLRVNDTLASLLTSASAGTPESMAFGPLRAWMAEAGVDAGSVVGATVFRTGDVTGEVARWVEWAGEQPADAPTGELTRTTVMDEYCAYEGVWDAPQFQDGVAPFTAEGGVLQVDGDGLPVVQGTQPAPFVIAVPKTAMPAEGFPLLFYVNGTGGLARQILDRGISTETELPPPGTGPAQNLARRGIGVSGIAGPLTPERIGPEASNDGYILYNFINPRGMRDNFAQAMIEHTMFRRLVLSLRIDPTTCAGVDASAAGDGMVRYDPAKVAIMGQSLGSYLSGMLAATDPGYRGAVLTGAGGSWIEFAFGPTDPIYLADAVGLLLGLPVTESLDVFHPVIALFDLGVGPADNTHYVGGIHETLRAGHEARHLLVIEGFEDDNIPENLQRALLGRVGVDLVGDDVGTERVLDAIELAGGTQLAGPVTANRLASDGTPVTAGVVRHLPDRPQGGHYVTFQLEAPKHQYGCFLETLFAAGTPTIVAGAGADDPCD